MAPSRFLFLRHSKSIRINNAANRNPATPPIEPPIAAECDDEDDGEDDGTVVFADDVEVVVRVIRDVVAAAN